MKVDDRDLSRYTTSLLKVLVHALSHFTLTTSSWARKTITSSYGLERSFKILSIYLQTQRTVTRNFSPKPVACHVLRCQSRILERYGLHPRGAPQGLRSDHIQQNEAHISGTPSPDKPPERLDSHSSATPRLLPGTLATLQNFFKTNIWTTVTKGWRASVPEKCREEKENEPQKKGGEQSSLGIPKPETLSSRPRTKQAEGIWVPHKEKRQKEQQWKKDLFPKQRGRKWTHSLCGLLIFKPYQYLKREAYGFVRYDLREFYANCPDTFTNRAQTLGTTHGNLYLLTAQFNAHTWRCCCVFKVNDQPCSIIKHSPTQTHIKLMITIVHFEGQKWSRNTVIKRSS